MQFFGHAPVHASLIPLGQPVTIIGLTNCVELNGEEGELIRWVEEKQRFAVDTPLGIKLLKPSNMTDVIDKDEEEELRLLYG